MSSLRFGSHPSFSPRDAPDREGCEIRSIVPGCKHGPSRFADPDSKRHLASLDHVGNAAPLLRR
jgi:hypothetical protein